MRGFLCFRRWLVDGRFLLACVVAIAHWSHSSVRFGAGWLVFARSVYRSSRHSWSDCVEPSCAVLWNHGNQRARERTADRNRARSQRSIRERDRSRARAACVSTHTETVVVHSIRVYNKLLMLASPASTRFKHITYIQTQRHGAASAPLWCASTTERYYCDDKRADISCRIYLPAYR